MGLRSRPISRYCGEAAGSAGAARPHCTASSTGVPLCCHSGAELSLAPSTVPHRIGLCQELPTPLTHRTGAALGSQLVGFLVQWAELGWVQSGAQCRRGAHPAVLWNGVIHPPCGSGAEL